MLKEDSIAVFANIVLVEFFVKLLPIVKNLINTGYIIVIGVAEKYVNNILLGGLHI